MTFFFNINRLILFSRKEYQGATDAIKKYMIPFKENVNDLRMSSTYEKSNIIKLCTSRNHSTLSETFFRYA